MDHYNRNEDAHEFYGWLEGQPIDGMTFAQMKEVWNAGMSGVYGRPTFKRSDLCQIQGCTEMGFCSSGNAGNRVICRKHFAIFHS